MTTTNQMNRRTINSIHPAGAVVVGNGLDGVLNGGNEVGLTFDLSQIAPGVTFTSSYEIRNTPDGAFGLAGSDNFASGFIHDINLTVVVGYELRVTLSHNSAMGVFDVPVECVIQG